MLRRIPLKPLIIFNISLLFGVVSRAWKAAVITAIPKTILLCIIEWLGKSRQILSWLKDHLAEKHTYVKVGNNCSECLNYYSVVPKGGVLSPLLFLAYYFDLPHILKTHPQVLTQMYADDVSNYGSYTEQNKANFTRPYLNYYV